MARWALVVLRIRKSVHVYRQGKVLELLECRAAGERHEVAVVVQVAELADARNVELRVHECLELLDRVNVIDKDADALLRHAERRAADAIDLKLCVRRSGVEALERLVQWMLSGLRLCLRHVGATTTHIRSRCCGSTR